MKFNLILGMSCRRLKRVFPPVAVIACSADFVAAKGLTNQADAAAHTLKQARMLRTTLATAALAVGSLVAPVQADEQESAIASEVLLQASEAWKGDEYQYPQGKPLITVKTVVFQPGAKSKPHSHDMPGAALIQSGELLCEVPATGLKKKFKAGDVLPTTFKNDLHTCENTGAAVAKALVFYAGAVGIPTSYYQQR